VDWNNDGRLDLITGERDGYVRIYLNTGTRGNPAFSGFTRLQVGSANFQTLSSKPFVVDWNNDSKLDVLVGDDEGLVYLLLNTGTRENPVFSASVVLLNGSQNLTAGTRASPVVADWTGNGKKDLIVGYTEGGLHLFVNVGTDAAPVFNGSPRRLQAAGSDINVSTYSRPAVTDWDNNGVLDLIVGCYGWNWTGLVWLFQGAPALWDNGFTDLGGGWRRLTWFGDYVPMGGAGWIWHNKHGFLYVPASSTPQNVWLYAQDMGWLYTGNALYPFLYRASPATWLWYNGSQNPRWFRNMTTGLWESRP
jgi:hypothetical protein